MDFTVRVDFYNYGNHSPRLIVGQVRRLADEFGRPGIMAKRGQTTQRALRTGHMRLVWPTRRLAREYQAMVEEFWGEYASTQRFIRRN